MSNVITIVDRALEPAERLARLEVVSAAGTREGVLTFGRPVLHRFGHPTAVLIEFSVALDPAGGLRRHRGLRYHVELTSPDAVVRGMLPSHPSASGVAHVDVDLALREGAGDPTIEFATAPTGITGYVEHGRIFGWRTASPRGTQRFVALVMLPAGSTALEGTLVAQLEVERRYAGRVEAVDTAPVSGAFRIPVEPAPASRVPRGPTDPGARGTLEANLPPRRTRGARPAGRAVSTGVAAVDRPDVGLPRDRCLEPGTDYLFWFGIGDAAADSIESRSVPVDLSDAATGTRLTVALFGFPGEIVISPDHDVDVLELLADGSVGVVGRPGERRLLFPISTPPREGRFRLRCNLYRNQTLLQSRLVTIEVAAGRRRQVDALRAEADYVADSALDRSDLAAITPLTLSIFMNANGDGTHGFRFLGSDGTELIKTDTAVSGLDNHLERARRALRRACWGTESELTDADQYKYGAAKTPDLGADLIALARAGSLLWWSVSNALARSRTPGPGEPTDPFDAIEALVRAPGTIEFASKDGGATVPAGLFYDYLLATQEAATDYTVCPVASAAIRDRADLAQEPCFQGRCPSHADPATEDDRVVCPGGFWGFRHRIGFPRTTRSRDSQARIADPTTSSLLPILFDGRPNCVVGAATDFDPTHPAAVAARGSAASQRVFTDRDALLAALRDPATRPHLVYLFCHGTVSDFGLPALRVGPSGSRLFTPDYVNRRMRWPDSRPLVVLNGCRTVAERAEWPIQFVDAFVQRGDASGVVGTEITTFESLAAAFGTLLVEGLLGRGAPVGEAVLAARLGLLAAGNPLGLIYTAYAAPALAFIPTA